MKNLIKGLLLGTTIFLQLATAQAEDASALCDQVFTKNIEFSSQVAARPNQNEITLISWIAHKFEDPQFFFQLKKYAETADILLIQEALHSTGWQNAFASHFPFHFSFSKSFCPSAKATGVMTASRFPMTSPRTLVSPFTEPVSFTPKVSVYTQLTIQNQIVHVVNTHALNFNIGSDFAAQIDDVVKYLSPFAGAIIWAGDFNTWSPTRKSYLETATKKLGLTHIKPKKEIRNLVLDHIYARGFDEVRTEVIKDETSDHYPLVTTLKLK